MLYIRMHLAILFFFFFPGYVSWSLENSFDKNTSFTVGSIKKNKTKEGGNLLALVIYLFPFESVFWKAPQGQRSLF